MSIQKINSKYCLNDRAQLMLMRGGSQVVFDKNEILYLRVLVGKDVIVNIHKYLTDKDRQYFPYHDRPVSKRQHNHIFECDTIYTEITCAGEESVFNFKLFKGTNTGDILVEELGIESFDSEISEMTVKADAVKKYLQKQPDESAKYIFDMLQAVNSGHGLNYVSANDCEQEINKLRIPLDNDNILKAYNKKNEPMNNYFSRLLGDADEESLEKFKGEREERVWKKSIDEVEEFSLTESGVFETGQPYMLIVKDGQIIAKHFDIRFIRENEFLIKERKYVISKDKFKISREINLSKIRFTVEPTFIKTEHLPPKTREEQFRKNAPMLIRTWEELAQVPPTNKVKIVIEDGKESGHIVPTDETEELKIGVNWQYLSTNTFYGSQYQQSTELLQKYGFNVEIDNWDKEEIKSKKGAKKISPPWLRRKK